MAPSYTVTAVWSAATTDTILTLPRAQLQGPVTHSASTTVQAQAIVAGEPGCAYRTDFACNCLAICTLGACGRLTGPPCLCTRGPETRAYSHQCCFSCFSCCRPRDYKRTDLPVQTSNQRTLEFFVRRLPASGMIPKSYQGRWALVRIQFKGDVTVDAALRVRWFCGSGCLPAAQQCANNLLRRLVADAAGGARGQPQPAGSAARAHKEEQQGATCMRWLRCCFCDGRKASSVCWRARRSIKCIAAAAERPVFSGLLVLGRILLMLPPPSVHPPAAWCVASLLPQAICKAFEAVAPTEMERLLESAGDPPKMPAFPAHLPPMSLMDELPPLPPLLHKPVEAPTRFGFEKVNWANKPKEGDSNKKYILGMSSVSTKEEKKKGKKGDESD